MRRLASCLCAVWLVACGETIVEEPLPDYEEPLDPGGIYLEIGLVRTGGAVSAGASRWLDAAVGLPTGQRGSYVAVARDGSDAIEDAVPFDFPEELLIEGVGDDGSAFRAVEPITDGSVATVRVRASASTREVTVYDPSGAVVATVMPPPGIGEALVLPRVSAELPRTGEPLLSRAISDYPHLDVLEERDRMDPTLVPASLRSIIEAIEPWSTTPGVGVVEEQLRAALPNTVRATARIGLVRFTADHLRENPNVLAVTAGNVLLLRADQLTSPRFRSTVVHELAHVYHYALGLEASDPAVSWPFEVRTFAAARLEASRLRIPVTEAWSRLHQSGVDAGLAGRYRGDVFDALDDTTAAREGFAAPYGAYDEGEDIAVYTESLVLPRSSGAPICRRFEDAGGRMTRELSTAYAKILLLRTLGFINSNVADRCTGLTQIFAAHGIAAPEPIGLLSSGVLAGFDDPGTRFLMRADRVNHRGLLELATRDRSPPLGLRYLSNPAVGGFYVDDTRVGFAFSDYYSTSGLVLLAVVDAARGVAGGAMFNVALSAEGTGRSIVLPFATFRYQR